MKPLLYVFSILCCFLLLPDQNLAQVDFKKELDLKAPIPMDPDVRTGTLPNGMKYYIKRNQKPENRAELRLAVHAGSMQEDPDQLGIAHFVEHMAFNGSENFAKNDLIDYLESVGTRFGPDLNAYTSFDETVYMLQARTDSIEYLQKGLLIFKDWAGGVSFEHEEIDKERGVVVSEWRSRLSPDQRLQQKYFPILYEGSRYAERLPIGDPELIETADHEVFKRFYKDWYRPELMALVVVGDVDLDWTEKAIKQQFSSLKNPDKPRQKEKYTVPINKGTNYAIFSDKEAAFTRVRVVYKHPKQKTKSIGDMKASLARSLYNRMLNARMVELQQQAEPPFTFAFSGYGGDIGDIDSYSASAFVKQGGVEKGIEAVMLETRRAMLYGFTETELERQKTVMIKSAEKAYNEKDKSPSGRMAMRYVYNFLEETPVPSPEQNLDLYKKLLPQITLEDINPLGKEWVKEDGRVVIVTGPEDEANPLPTKKDLMALFDRIEKTKVEPYEDAVVDAPLLDAALKPSTIKSEEVNEELGITEYRLANNIRVILKPTEFKNDEILMSAFSPGGHSLYDDEMYQSASSASSLVDLSGLGKFSVVELQKKLTGNRARVTPYIGELYEGFRGSSNIEDLETLFQLVYLYFTEPRKDEIALQSYVSRQKGILENMMADPDFFFAG